MIVVSLREFTIVVSLNIMNMHQRKKNYQPSGNAYISPRIWRERYWEVGGYTEEIIKKITWERESERDRKSVWEKEISEKEKIRRRKTKEKKIDKRKNLTQTLFISLKKSQLPPLDHKYNKHAILFKYLHKEAINKLEMYFKKKLKIIFEAWIF